VHQYVVSPLGWPVILIGLFGFIILLCSYSAVACGDPGIIFSEPDESVLPGDQLLKEDEEENAISEGKATISSMQEVPLNDSSGSSVSKFQVPRVMDTIECGTCNIQRPLSATQ